MKKALALLTALVVAISILGCSTSMAKKRLVAQSATVYIGPKIDQPGTVPASVGDAAGIGSAQIKPVDKTRRVKIQARAKDSSNSWSTVKSGYTDGSGMIYFDVWSSQEYRAVAVSNTNYSQIISAVKTYDWQVIFEDEFDGDTLDSQWQPRGTSYTSAMTRAKSDISACDVSGGVLHVKAILDPDNPGKYLNCHVGTQNSFTFGPGTWAAARVRFHRFSGSHAAFWWQSVDGYVPDAAEVDVAEYFGSTDPNNVNGTKLQYQNYYDWSDDNGANIQGTPNYVNDVDEFGANSGYKWWNSYHVYSVRWLDNAYMFYIDGHKIKKVTTGVGTKPAFLVLSMLTRDYEADRMQDDRIDTYSMDVDWVRVWN